MLKNWTLCALLVTSSFLPIISKAAVEFSDGSVIALWHFNDDSVDASGNGYNGTDTSITYSTGKLNNASVFNGTSGYITFSNKITPIGTKSFSFWFKSNDQTNIQAIYNNNALDSGESGIEIYTNTSGYLIWALTYGAGGGARRWSQTSNIDIIDNNWHFITLTWDGTTGTNKVKMYIDGVLNQQATSSGTESNTPTDNLRISKLSFGPSLYYINGSLDEFAVFNTELTTTQISLLYNSSTGDYICTEVGCGPSTGTSSSSIQLCTGETCDKILEHTYLWLVVFIFGSAGILIYKILV